MAAAESTVSYVRAVGQEASPSKRVLLCTSKAACRRMTAWRMGMMAALGLSSLMFVIWLIIWTLLFELLLVL